MRRRFLITLLSVLFSQTSFAGKAPERPELEVIGRHFGPPNITLEISGINVAPTGFFAIADDKDDRTIFHITLTNTPYYKMEREFEFDTLEGFKTYMADLWAEETVQPPDRRFDIEGITSCGNTTYLVNERVRHLIAIENQRSIKRVTLDLSPVKELFEGGINAGFEGVAADCANQIMYIAKEREPRRVIQVDMRTWKVTRTFDFPASNRSPQSVINLFTGDGMMVVAPDLSDIVFENGYLYALERNSYEIAKIDLKTTKVVARVSYLRAEKPLYETGEPFGTAEALALTPKEIILGFDNNGSPLSGTTRDKYQVSGNASAIFRFTRPAGF